MNEGTRVGDRRQGVFKSMIYGEAYKEAEHGRLISPGAGAYGSPNVHSSSSNVCIDGRIYRIKHTLSSYDGLDIL